MKEYFKNMFIIGAACTIIALIIGGVHMLKNANQESQNETKNTVQENTTIVDIVDTKIEEEKNLTEYSSKKLGRCTEALNFRELDDKDSVVMTVIPKNEIIELVGETKTGWYQIKYNSKVGFVSKEYTYVLTEEESKAYEVVREFQNTYARSTVSLNIREAPGKNGKTLSTVKESSVLKVFKEMGNRLVSS